MKERAKDRIERRRAERRGEIEKRYVKAPASDEEAARSLAERLFSGGGTASGDTYDGGILYTGGESRPGAGFSRREVDGLKEKIKKKHAAHDAPKPKARPSAVYTVDLEAGMPPAREAVETMRRQLAYAQAQGYKAVRLIHGYGSSGKGGAIRAAVRETLAGMRASGKIALFVPGEDFSVFDPAAREAMRLVPEMRAEPDLENHNPGVTFVVP